MWEALPMEQTVLSLYNAYLLAALRDFRCILAILAMRHVRVFSIIFSSS